jgi:hypothetical protein
MRASGPEQAMSAPRHVFRACPAFSIVEVVLATGLVLLLAGIGIGYYDDLREAARRQAALSDLDAMRVAVHRWQVEHRAAYTDAVPPRAGDVHTHRDPWGQPYRIRTDRRLLYSTGLNAADDGGGGDDVALGYDPHAVATAPAPPSGFRVSESGPAHVRLAWNPPADPARIRGYNVYRRESLSQSTYSTEPLNPRPVPPAASPSYEDATVVPGQVYYYALEVVATDGATARAAGQVGFQLTR